MKSMINLVNWKIERKKKGKILIEIELNNTGQSMMMMIVIENERNNLDYWTIFYNSISVKIEKEQTNMNVVEEKMFTESIPKKNPKWSEKLSRKK